MTEASIIQTASHIRINCTSATFGTHYCHTISPDEARLIASKLIWLANKIDKEYGK